MKKMRATMGDVRYLNKEARYHHLFNKKDRTASEEKEFEKLCDIILLELLEKNKDILKRLKNR